MSELVLHPVDVTKTDVQTKCGLEAWIVGYDEVTIPGFPICTVIKDEDHSIIFVRFALNGVDLESTYKLINTPERLVRYVNLFYDDTDSALFVEWHTYPTAELAAKRARRMEKNDVRYMGRSKVTLEKGRFDDPVS